MLDKTILFNDLYIRTFVTGDVEKEDIEIVIDKMNYLLNNFNIDVSNTQIKMLKLAKEEIN